MRVTANRRRKATRQGLERLAADPDLRENFHNLPRAPIQLICCKMSKEVNHGGLVRLAEAFRLENVVFEQEEDSATDFSGLMGTDKWQKWEFGEPQEAILRLKDNGYKIFALTLNDSAVPLESIQWQFPCAIVLGQEKLGIPDGITALADHVVAIPMYGLITSLNVSQAAGITVHSAMQAYRLEEPSFEPARQSSRDLIENG